MKYVLAHINVYGDTDGYWTETYCADTGTMQGKVVKDIQESDAKIYTNFEQAALDCQHIGNNCDLLLRVIPYYDESSLINNKKDYCALLKILLEYSAEDIAQTIANALPLTERVKLSNELNCLNSGIRPSL